MYISTSWCEHCDEHRADYRVYYSTDQFLGKWSTFSGEQYMSKVCLECFHELTRQERKGLIWSVGHRLA